MVVTAAVGLITYGLTVGTIGATMAIAAGALAASLTYSAKMLKKMKDRQKSAEEARRGLEVVRESEIISLPIIYGRAKIGGVVAWAQTRSDLNSLVNSTSNSVDVIGNPFEGYRSGSKNEYLVIQQALCQGPIHKFYDFIVDDNNSYLNTDFKRIYADCHTNGGLNTNILNNFSDRASAYFTGVAYANIFIMADRDNPKEIPQVSFLIEGRKIRNITRTGSLNNYTYTVTSERVYSNNPALCLLDYLLEDTSNPVLNISTKALSIDEIDLESFYNAKIICEKIVQTNVKVGGRIWQPTNGSRFVTSRNLPLYECNLVIDTSSSIRDNIEDILTTMGDARLIWSLGKYKLLLQYPTNS